jgi:3-phenylpropionate/trans-cinnamate dioxygenase ferredoxin reductase subunit
VAASARQKGLDVTLIEHADVPLERVLGREVGAIYAEIHRDHGVELLTGQGVEAFEGSEHVEAVRLAGGGARVECDFVVVGVGVTPRVDLAAAAGLSVDDGIVVDQTLATSDPAIFAAGDVANAWHPFYERHLRVEHWANALNQPRTAAQGMLGKAASYDRLPYFFSDQYEVGMEYTGYATEWDEVVLRGDVAKREFIAFWLKDHRVLAGMNVGVWDVTDPIRALIASRKAVDPAALADADVPLDRL